MQIEKYPTDSLDVPIAASTHEFHALFEDTAALYDRISTIFTAIKTVRDSDAQVQSSTLRDCYYSFGISEKGGRKREAIIEKAWSDYTETDSDSGKQTLIAGPTCLLHLCQFPSGKATITRIDHTSDSQGITYKGTASYELYSNKPNIKFGAQGLFHAEGTVHKFTSNTTRGQAVWYMNKALDTITDLVAFANSLAGDDPEDSKESPISDLGN